MSRLCMYLPPFAGDYSGVCSTFYELGGMICIHDAAGCTGNYTGFDEPRWYGSDKMVYCTGLRKIDAALGNDKKFIDRIVVAAKELNPKFIVIVGSPVPFIIGFDFQGVAREIEAITRIPTFGFETNGIQGSYKDGVVMATEVLLKEFAKTGKKRDCTKIKINIVGATPLDISDENYCLLEKFLKDHDIEINCSIAMNSSIEQIERAYDADLNIAITQAGLISCIKMEIENHLPYLVGLPIGKMQNGEFVEAVRSVLKTKQSNLFIKTENSNKESELLINKESNVLILGDAVIGKSIKNEIFTNGVKNIDLFSLFGIDEGCKLMGISSLVKEEEIFSKVNEKKYSVIIADPLITDLRIDRKEVQLVDLPQYGISSKLSNQKKWNYIGDSFNQHLNNIKVQRT